MKIFIWNVMINPAFSERRIWINEKKSFDPQISRVKLNPEQAVLQCDCFNRQLRLSYTAPYYNLLDFRLVCVSGRTFDGACNVVTPLGPLSSLPTISLASS